MIEDRIVVSVIDRKEGDRRRATVLEGAAEAQRLVEALIAAGCDERDVGVFRSHDVGIDVAYRFAVQIEGRTPDDATSGKIQSLAASIGPAEQSAVTRPASTAVATTGGWSINVRADRLVWVCLWTVSIVVLVASLLASLSRPAPREFTPGAPSPDAQSSAPRNSVLASQSAPLISQASHLPACAQGGQDNCRCSDFATQADAQAFYQRFPPAPGHIVDTDGDGVFCEWLPAAAPSGAP